MLKSGDFLENKYRIDELLSRGGFGRVWKAFDTILERNVAVKELIDVKEDKLTDFVAEMQILAKLDCELIVKIFQAIPLEDNIYLVMEYCPQGTLWNVIRKEKKLSVDQAIEYTIDVCKALSIVHENNIVHHDIKPSNILIGNDEKIKISDFGVANTLLGTIQYLAPEQFSRNADPDDPRTDIYALGVTLYEMVAGDVPFKGEYAQVVNGHLNEQVQFPTHLPEWLCDIIRKAVAKQPDLRFQSAAVFQYALETRKAPAILKPSMLSASQWNAGAEKLMHKKQWQKARAYLEESLRLYPDYPLAHSNIGVCCLKLAQLDRAEHHLNEGKRHPTPEAAKSFGELYIEKQEYGKAISSLSEYIFKHPLDYAACNLLGRAYYEVGYYDRAAELYVALLSKKPGDTIFTNNLILSYFFLGKDKQIEAISKKEYAEDIGYHYIKYNRDVLFEDDLIWHVNQRESAKPKTLFAPYYEEKKSGPISKKRAWSNLVMLELPSYRKTMKSTEPIISIGRNDSNTFALPDRNISRRHCVLIKDEEKWVLVDLGSSVGTFVADKKIKKITLYSGIENIKISHTDCRLILGQH